MNKRSFFVNTFNWIPRLFIFGLVFIIFGTVLCALPNTSYKINFPIVDFIANLFTIAIYWINQLGKMMPLIGSLQVIVGTVLVILEIINRIKCDSLSNLWQSIEQTTLMRKFLKKNNDPKPEMNEQGQFVKKYDPVATKYNKKVLNAVVDVRANTITLIIPKPEDGEAFKLLNNDKQAIKSKFTDMNSDDYQFSDFVDEKDKYLILNGTKIK